MLPYQGLRQQAIAVSSASRKSAHFACLFTQGGSHAKKGEFAGMGCFEGVAFLVMVQFRHHLATNESALKLRFEPRRATLVIFQATICNTGARP